MNGDIFPNPIIEVSGADGEGITVEDRWDTHRGLPTVGKTIKTDSLRINKRERLQPIQNLLVLRYNDGKKRLPERVGFAL